MTNDSFEGLDLPQLMELLKPLVYPEPVSWFPQTVGWQIIGAWLLAVSLISLVAVVRRYRRNRYRREALVCLEEISPVDPDSAVLIGTLLKRTAMAVYPRDEIASLTGDEWAQFLVASAPGSTDRTEALLLAGAPYATTVSHKQLKKAAGQWIRDHRA